MNDLDHSAGDHAGSGSFWSSRVGMALVAFLAVAAVLLVYEHRIHVFTGSGLLFVLLGFCVLVHLFMHGGHGGHGSGGGGLPPGRGDGAGGPRDAARKNRKLAPGKELGTEKGRLP